MLRTAAYTRLLHVYTWYGGLENPTKNVHVNKTKNKLPIGDATSIS